VRRKDGSIEKLQGCDATVIDVGEAVIIQTPTAGGYGTPDQSAGAPNRGVGR
jgi:5-oxoprolinase (ATP-hydrolysing)